MENELINNFLSFDIDTIKSLASLNELEMNYGCVDGKIIGTGRSDYTIDSEEYNLSIYDKPFSLIDIPGIEGDESKFEDIIKKSLEKSHTVFYVNGSGKKIEKNTLEKIKKYMHDGTSVYAVFNVHCKAKKKRLAGIDKTFSAELSEAYMRQQEIVDQTEKELVSILGDSFKGSLMVNGLLSFCSLAYDKKNLSTIVWDSEKNLRADQNKYSNEYNYNINMMFDDSHIEEIKQIVSDKVYNFEKTIYDENIKKLKNRISEITDKIALLNDTESKKLAGFRFAYDDYLATCEEAKVDYIDNLTTVGEKSAEAVLSNVKNKIFNEIDKRCSNKESPKKIEKFVNDYFDSNIENIKNKIQAKISKNINSATDEYLKRLEEASESLQKDISREQMKFNIDIDDINIDISDKLRNSLKTGSKEVVKVLWKIGSSAWGGFELGSFYPGIGSVIGTIAGALFGIIDSIWWIFTTRANKTNKIKNKVDDSFNELSQIISKSVRENVLKSGITKDIENECLSIRNKVEQREQSLEDVEKLLKTTLDELNYKKRMMR